ncbi:hypothetical protein [Sphaerisporangium album]|nr:hypothetical protein [Sphaerisporangium album]
METVDLEDLGLELLLITALHEEAERLTARLPGPSDDAIERGRTFRRT